LDIHLVDDVVGLVVAVGRGLGSVRLAILCSQETGHESVCHSTSQGADRILTGLLSVTEERDTQHG
jgi:hypothetical protein